MLVLFSNDYHRSITPRPRRVFFFCFFLNSVCFIFIKRTRIRWTPDRRRALSYLGSALRHRHYLPLLFVFDFPSAVFFAAVYVCTHGVYRRLCNWCCGSDYIRRWRYWIVKKCIHYIERLFLIHVRRIPIQTRARARMYTVYYYYFFFPVLFPRLPLATDSVGRRRRAYVASSRRIRSQNTSAAAVSCCLSCASVCVCVYARAQESRRWRRGAGCGDGRLCIVITHVRGEYTARERRKKECVCVYVWESQEELMCSGIWINTSCSNTWNMYTCLYRL